MPSLKDKIRFAEKHIRDPKGQPFSLEGRQWVIDQLWRPLDGWKLWPIDPDRLCESCSKLANTIVDDYHAPKKTQTKAHNKKAKCSGLKSEPILICAVELKRQQGKTFNSATLSLARTFLDDHESIALLAGSEDQVGRLYSKNYKGAVEQSEALSENCIAQGTSIRVPDKGSDLEILPTAISSVGDTRTLVIVDECRIVPPDVAVAMLATLFARGGWQCPDYHIRSHKGVDDPEAPEKCSVCKKPTVPWYGKALLLSSAGEIKDSDRDWFFEFIDKFSNDNEPHPNVHVFATKETLNPSTSVKMVDTVSEVFGALESTKAFAGVEAEGHRLRRGDDVVSPSDVKRVCDRSLTNEDGCKNKCVGFLDTSTSVEKTSFVILAEDPESEFPWEHIYLSHLKYWWPGVNTKAKYIDGNEVKRYLENLLPLYPNLQIFEVDTKVGAVKKDKGLEAQWPVQMMRDIRKLSGKWVGKVKTWKGGGSESQTGWDLLEERILRQTILLQDVKAIKDEFKGVKRGAPKEGKRKVEDRKRDKMHRDITEGIACSCYRIGILKMRAFSGMSMAAIRQKTTRTPKDQLEKRRREEMSPRPLRFRPRGDPDQY